MNEVWRGHPNAVPLSGIAVVVIMLCSLVTRGLQGVFLMYMATIPVCVILFALRYNNEKRISANLSIEMFWSGAVLSIAVAFILESVAQLQTRSIWRCQRSANWTWQCDLSFLTAVIFVVGFSEEFAKLLPLGRIKTSASQIPFVWSSYYRLIDNPMGFFIGACCAAAGFACVENIKYTSTVGSDNLEMALDTSLFRGLLAVPFHIACTGFVAALYAKHIFISKSEILKSISNNNYSNNNSLGGLSSKTLLVQQQTSNQTSSNPRSNRLQELTLGLNSKDESYTMVKRCPMPTSYSEPRGASNLLNRPEYAQFIVPVQYALTPTVQTISSDNSEASIPSSLLRKPVSLKRWLLMLSVPVLLHGLYDAGLFGAAQFISTAHREHQRVLKLMPSSSDRVPLSMLKSSGDEIMNKNENENYLRSNEIIKLNSQNYILKTLSDNLLNENSILSSFLLTNFVISNSHLNEDCINSSTSQRQLKSLERKETEDSQILNTVQDNDDEPVSIYRTSDRYPLLESFDKEIKKIEDDSHFYLTLSMIALVISFICYATMILLFLIQWFMLWRWQKHSEMIIPRLVPHSDFIPLSIHDDTNQIQSHSGGDYQLLHPQHTDL